MAPSEVDTSSELPLEPYAYPSAMAYPTEFSEASDMMIGIVDPVVEPEPTAQLIASIKSEPESAIVI